VTVAGIDRAALADTLKRVGADGWLLYDFLHANPVATRVLGLGGLGKRRLFVWLPAQGNPVAVAHRIELQPMEDFPGEVRPYAAWQELHDALGGVVRGRRVAMEVFPEDAVPYLDRVPAGVVQLVEKLGGTVVPSAELVTRFAAGWSSAERKDHEAAAELLADIARTTLAEVLRQPGKAEEYAVQQQVLERMRGRGLQTTDPPIVAFGANAANAHYEPSADRRVVLEANQVVLLDLWGGRSLQTVFADQTWMGFAGSAPPDDVRRVWEIVRDARDTAIEHLRRAHAAGESVTGAALDAAARAHITEHGYGEYFIHRLGHSIDTELHGSGPHLDGFETNDVRQLVPGIGFSVEPGIYLPGKFGVRSEVNVMLLEEGPVVTPREPQARLLTA
jgi:Xaa-Pro aminopeptidase